MKLSVAAYRASASNVNRHLSHPVRHQHLRQKTTHTEYNATMSRSLSWGSDQVDVGDVNSASLSGPGPPASSSAPMMVDISGASVSTTTTSPVATMPPNVTFAPVGSDPGGDEKQHEVQRPQLHEEDEEKRSLLGNKPQPHQRSRGNQRWMKLRTTVQLTGAVASAVKDKKPPLKREDSFLKRFSTRQIGEPQDTVDGDGTLAGDGGTGATRRRRRRRREGPLTVINPDENFYFAWLSLLTVCVLYNLWTLIVRQALPELQQGWPALWYAGDAFSDVVFLCDVVVQFRTGYLEQGLMVYDSKKLAQHYMKSRAFTLDLASLLPLDLIQLLLGEAHPMVRFPRFLKVYRSYNYYYMVESRTLYPNLWRVVNLIHVLLLLAHWFGCFYYLLSEAEGFHGHWVYPPPNEDFATLTRKYLGSLYWSTLTLTTIGDLPTPETNYERQKLASTAPLVLPRRGHKSRLLYLASDGGYLFTIVSYLIGVFIFATIVGQVGNVITNRNASRLEFERLLDGAKLYMRQHKVPRDMQRRVQRWYDYSWSRGRMQGGGDINSALGILPDKLKTELALHVNLNTLKKVSIFQECQPEFLHDLVLKMKAYIFTPGDLICRKGEVAREMFIIADGILEVISETGKVLTTMRAGDFFGEIGILNLDGLNKRTADVRSVGYSELFSLSREDVLAAMKDYPEAQEILQSLGRKRLMEAKMAAAGIKRDADSDSRKGSSGGNNSTGGDKDSAKSRAAKVMKRLKRDAKGIRNFLFKRGQSMSSDSKIEMETMPSPDQEEVLTREVTCDEARLSDSTFAGRFPWTRRESQQPDIERQSRLLRTKTTRGILTRMQRVNSQVEPGESPPTPGKRVILATEAPDQPLGAGLPLLQRLKLLKEKQVSEAKQQQQPSFQPAVPSAPPVDEPLGAGLPMLKRLKLLREKEEREQRERERTSAAATAAAAAASGLILGEKNVATTSAGGAVPALSVEPTGSGAPLFQRLRRLKEREDPGLHDLDSSSSNGGGKLSIAKATLLKKLETLREEEKSACESMEKSRSIFEEEWPSQDRQRRPSELTPLVSAVSEGSAKESEGGKVVQVLLHRVDYPTSPETTPATPASASETSPLLPPTPVQAKDGDSKGPVKKTGWQAFKAAVMKQPSNESKTPKEASKNEDKDDGTNARAETGKPATATSTTNSLGEITTVTTSVTNTVTTAVSESEEKLLPPSLKVKLDKSVPLNLNKNNHPHAIFDPSLPHRPMDFKPEEYLADLLVGVKQVLQARLEDIQNQFKSRLVTLEEEVRRKDMIIKRLEEALHHSGDQPSSETGGRHSATPQPILDALEDVLSDGSNRSSPQEEICQPLSASPLTDDGNEDVEEEDDYFEDEFEEASDVTHPGYVSHPRRSWPLLPPWSERHRKSDRHHQQKRPWESQAALDIDPEQLWRVEFPAESGGHWSTIVTPEEGENSENERTLSETSDDVFNTEDPSPASVDVIGSSKNDWEIKLLAEQLLKNESAERTDSESSQGGSGGGGKMESQRRMSVRRTLRVEDVESFGDSLGPSPKEGRRSSAVSTPDPRERGNDDDGANLDDDKHERIKESVPSVSEVPSKEGDTQLLGVLQQLSPTERRELERLLEVATRRHLSRQMSLQVQGDRVAPLPHQRSLGEPSVLVPASNGGPSYDSVRRRNSAAAAAASSADPSSWPHPVVTLFPPPPPSSAYPHAESTDAVNGGDAYPLPPVTTSTSTTNSNNLQHHQQQQCFFETETDGRPPVTTTATPTTIVLLSPPAEEELVSICIPECEPLLGPK